MRARTILRPSVAARGTRRDAILPAIVAVLVVVCAAEAVALLFAVALGPLPIEPPVPMPPAALPDGAGPVLMGAARVVPAAAIPRA